MTKEIFTLLKDLFEPYIILGKWNSITRCRRPRLRTLLNKNGQLVLTTRDLKVTVMYNVGDNGDFDTKTTKTVRNGLKLETKE